MYTQGTGCLFTYNPGIKEIIQIHSRAFEVPNTYVRWEGREIFITRFVADGERDDSYGAIMWTKFCDWLENTGYFQPTYKRAEWNSLASQMSDESVTAANNSR